MSKDKYIIFNWVDASMVEYETYTKAKKAFNDELNEYKKNKTVGDDFDKMLITVHDEYNSINYG